MSTLDDHKESRIAVLETRAEFIIKNMALHEERDDVRFREQGIHLERLANKLDDISSRLDRQNGTIPHVLEALNQLVTRVDNLTARMEKVSEKSAETRWKTNLIYAVLGGLLSIMAYAVTGFYIHGTK